MLLECEGYRMFKGKAFINPASKNVCPFVEDGVWLYKPEYDCWYCNGHSYPAEIVKILEDRTDGNISG